jgi:hypothetical protein
MAYTIPDAQGYLGSMFEVAVYFFDLKISKFTITKNFKTSIVNIPYPLNR